VVQVKNLTANQSENDILFLNVKINENLSKIQEVLGEDGVQGFLTYNGKLVESPKDTTFAKLFVKNNGKIAVVSAAGSGLQPIMWVRFPEFYYTDYFYMNTRYWDAVVFKPKRTIWFFGWGLFANYNGKDIKVKIQWKIDEEQSEEFEMEFADGSKDAEKKWHTIDIRDVGVKPIKVNEGQVIHVKTKVDDDEMRRCFYGYSGS